MWRPEREACGDTGGEWAGPSWPSVVPSRSASPGGGYADGGSSGGSGEGAAGEGAGKRAPEEGGGRMSHSFVFTGVW